VSVVKECRVINCFILISSNNQLIKECRECFNFSLPSLPSAILEKSEQICETIRRL